MNLQGRKYLAAAMATCGVIAAGVPSWSKSADLSDFYIVSEGFSDVVPGWHRSVLEIKPEGADLLVRYIRADPAHSFCGDTLIGVLATRLPDTSLHTVTRDLNFCAIDSASLSRTFRAFPPTQPTVALAGDYFTIVAKCGADIRVIRLPGKWEVDMARLMREQSHVAALWTLEKAIGTRAFGPFPSIDVVPPELAARLQPADQTILAELNSGKFDAGLTKGPFQRDVAALRPAIEGPEYTVKLADADQVHVEHYVNPKYPPLALQARISGTVELELTSNPATGEIERVTPVSGHPLLLPSSTGAAQQWRVPPGADHALRATRVKLEFQFHCP